MVIVRKGRTVVSSSMASVNDDDDDDDDDGGGGGDDGDTSRPGKVMAGASLTGTTRRRSKAVAVAPWSSVVVMFNVSRPCQWGEGTYTKVDRTTLVSRPLPT